LTVTANAQNTLQHFQVRVTVSLSTRRLW